MEKPDQSRKLMVISLIALVSSFVTMILVFQIHTNNKTILESYAKDRSDKDIYKELKKASTQQVVITPGMIEGDEFIVNCAGTHIATEQVQSSSVSIVCGTYSQKNSRGKDKQKEPTGGVELSTSPDPSDAPGVSDEPDPSDEPDLSESPDPSDAPGVSDAPKPSKSPSPSISSSAGFQAGSVTLALKGVGNYAQAGTVTLKSLSATQVRVDIDTNDIGLLNQPAHIHLGSCASPGAVKYSLTSVSRGKSRTTVNASMTDLLNGNLIINIHKSVAESQIYTSCGEVKI